MNTRWTRADVDAFNAKSGQIPPKIPGIPAVASEKAGNSPQIPIIPGGDSGNSGKFKIASFALGRLKTGKMNKTEALYRDHLELEKRAGVIQNYWFEAINLRIGDNCFYRPDFLVMMADRSLELHETKGWMTDDALVKIRAVAAMYPFPLKVVKLVKGVWEIKEY
ncbi:hypothetical protein [Niabella aurantiaca]|uniref:hypothetical protein n=1 Tax=Niabella aurantiaca TaxID=379900 RepID=UPI0003723D8F|nr:hypothetical protein [Niabella aurantiaca]